jgi:hypothetical protein
VKVNRGVEKFFRREEILVEQEEVAIETNKEKNQEGGNKKFRELNLALRFLCSFSCDFS